jgi:hypothetical protein
MKIALAQINPVVGDFSYNADKIVEAAATLAISAIMRTRLLKQPLLRRARGAALSFCLNWPCAAIRPRIC